MTYIPHHTRSRHLLIGMRKEAVEMKLPASAVRPHRLILYAKLVNDNSAINFTLDRRSSEYPLDVALDENDAFLAHAMSLEVHPVKIIGGEELPALSYRVAYPDPNIFAGPAINGVTEAESIEMVYNALLQIETEQDIRLKEFETSIFRTVPRTQTSGATVPQSDGSQLKDLVSALIFTGGSRTDFTVQLNSRAGNYSAIAGTATRANYAVLTLDGLIITGGSKKVAAGRLNKFLSTQ